MTLKDWKKVESGIYKRGTHKITIEKEIKDWDIKWAELGLKGPWIVNLPSGGMVSFRTKSLALAYAKSYMRKH